MIGFIELIALRIRGLNVYDEPPTTEKLQQNH
jgi:hypothetical protein